KVFYEIESKDGDVGRDVLYNADGSVAEIEETVAISDLPAAIRESIKSKYPNAVITKAEKTTQGEKVGYEVIARQRRKRISLEFDADGNVKK
ncbi:MAG TPA: PepSY-like domain-containing protein, partial [Pyrinomonadaceae bacterium]